MPDRSWGKRNERDLLLSVAAVHLPNNDGPSSRGRRAWLIYINQGWYAQY